jgi:hypothetical protein
MRGWLCLVGLAGMLAACTTTSPPDRLVFGVSGDRPAAAAGDAQADANMRTFLDAKANQICTLGYDTVKVDTVAAEGDQQIVDEELRCKPYHVTFF